MQYDWISDDEIRLLHLHPAALRRAPVKCHLTVHTRTQTPEYSAVSYTWGDVTLQDAIHCNEQALSVAASCTAVLRALRNKTSARVLWIDAVCINQNDTKERSAQVARMGEVFRFGKQTFAYLGDSGTHFTEKSGARDWAALLQRSWFNRTWARKLIFMRSNYSPNCFQVIQETLLSREIIFVVGTQEISLGEFLRHCKIFKVSYPALLALREELVYEYGVRPPRAWQVDSDGDHIFTEQPAPVTFSEPVQYDAATLRSEANDVKLPVGHHGLRRWNSITNVRTRKETIDDGSLDLNYWRLPNFLHKTRSFQCRDVRDKLYAVLGLFCRPIPALLQPNYDKPTHDVLADLSWFIIQQGQPDALMYVNGYRAVDVPSWATDWSLSSIRAPLSQKAWHRAGYQSGAREVRAERLASDIKLRGLHLGTVLHYHHLVSSFVLSFMEDYQPVKIVVRITSTYAPSQQWKWFLQTQVQCSAESLFMSQEVRKRIIAELENGFDKIQAEKPAYWSRKSSPSEIKELVTMQFPVVVSNRKTCDAVHRFYCSRFAGLQSIGRCEYTVKTGDYGFLADIVARDDPPPFSNILQGSSTQKRQEFGHGEVSGGISSNQPRIDDSIVALLGFPNPFILRKVDNMWNIIGEVTLGASDIMEGKFMDAIDWSGIWSEPCPRLLTDYWIS